MYRRLGNILAPGVLAAVGMGIAVGPDTFMLPYAQKATQSYRNGFPVPVPPNVHEIISKAKNDILAAAPSLSSHNISEERLNHIQPYTVFGFEMFRLGYLRTEYGGWLGVPEYFKYTDGCPASKRIIVVNKSVPWEDPAGKMLKDSLSISEDAKQFAIAREALLLCQDETDFRCANTLGNMMVSLTLARGLHKRFNLGTRSLVLSGLVYSMVVTVGVTFWILFNDILRLMAERTADSATASLGERYVRAGVEYCESIVKRNLALRDLMGEDGDSLYTACGNEQTLVRTRHVPIVERLNFFKKKLEAFNNQQSDPEA